MKCLWCTNPAMLRVDSGVVICGSCWEQLEPRIRVINPASSVIPIAGVDMAAGDSSPMSPPVAIINSSSCGSTEGRALECKPSSDPRAAGVREGALVLTSRAQIVSVGPVGINPNPHDSIPNPAHGPNPPVLETSAASCMASPISSFVDPGVAGFDNFPPAFLDSRNSRTLRVVAHSDSVSKSIF